MKEAFGIKGKYFSKNFFDNSKLFIVFNTSVAKVILIPQKIFVLRLFEIMTNQKISSGLNRNELLTF